MGPTHEELQMLFDGMSDEELDRRLRTGMLTEIAHQLAVEEMARRRLAVPLPAPMAPPEELPARAPAGERRFVLLRRYADVMDAQTLRARLEAEGVPVLLGGANHSLAMGFFSPVLGGTRLEVPEDMAAQAREVMEAFDAGMLMLEEEPGAVAETPGNGLWSTDRRQLREFVAVVLVLLFAGADGLSATGNFIYAWRRDPAGELLPYWPYLFPLLYIVAAILFALRSKWSLVLFAAHLLGALGVQIAWSLMDDSMVVIMPGTVLATGLILFYGMYQLAHGRWR